MNDAEKTLLETIGVRESVREIHRIITEKHPAGATLFDAWYTNREEFWKNIDRLSRSTAQKLREALRFEWRKDLDQQLVKILEKKGTAPKNWEDGPDGALVGLAIIVSAWVAHQAGEKTANNPENAAKALFEEYFRPLVIAAMEEGLRMAAEKK
jgi:hypothetical protein